MSRKAKKGSKAYRAKLSKAQKQAWAKRKQVAVNTAKSYTVLPETTDDDIAREKLREEFSPSKWINAADTPKERQLRKAAMHAVLYSGGLANNEEGLLRTARRIRNEMEAEAARKEQLAAEGIETERWTGGATTGRWEGNAGCQQSNVPKSEFSPDTFLNVESRLAADASEKLSNPKTLTGQQKVPVLSVVPPASIIAQATAMRYGAFFAPKIDGTKGYGPYNWRDQPIEAHIYIDAAMRHLMQWWDGEDNEVIYGDNGMAIDVVSHLAFALATIGILLDAQANDTLIDDRPKVNKMAATGLLQFHKISPRKSK